MALIYVPKLIDGMIPFALGAGQCFSAYFVAHGARGWYWSLAAICVIGCLGYVNAEVNARLNPAENDQVLAFYGRHLRILQLSTLLLAAICTALAGFSKWPDEILIALTFVITAGYALTD
ncbi:conserved membrane hypothetical protein [Candidatus Methylobacter favarea]|uniref:Uncharacterized protein n=1 Tax=Candidatus Methylobacter favarea TaxID=2707345 RepID=A0A8S0Y722_9GAMM|nr:hypothetical protein [Candidatus Methylobacter favarea]CAA9892739.1 conserved membrane hypothetical protein [Candidatus Methylobacter favarea]